MCYTCCMDTQQTKVKWYEIVEVEANTGATDGEHFLEQAKAELSIWGGLSHSDGVVNEAGDVRISFDPHKADGGPLGILRWLDAMDIEYTARFMRWKDE